jgi:hypothetical protein
VCLGGGTSEPRLPSQIGDHRPASQVTISERRVRVVGELLNRVETSREEDDLGGGAVRWAAWP